MTATVAPKRKYARREPAPVVEVQAIEQSPPLDALIGRGLHEAVRALLDARKLALSAGRIDDARDVGVVISTLAHCARRVDNRASNARVIAFRPEAVAIE